MDGISLIVTFFIALVVMIVLISKYKVHPFFAIMGISLILAIVVGLPLADIPKIIGQGFSGTFNSIGIVIILGAFIGIVLEETGAALKLAEIIVRLVGKAHPELAMQLMGWIVSVPVFCDSGFVILDPIRKALCKKTRYSSVAMTVALSAGLYTSHVFIPPTPGPIAAANTLGVGSHLLLLIFYGTIISVPCLISAYIFANFIGKRVKSAEDVSDSSDITYDELLASFGKLPNGFMSLSPIIMPIIFMALGSIAHALKWKGSIGEICIFIGTPIIALSIGTLFALLLLVSGKKGEKWFIMTDTTLRVVGPILFITAAGGVLGKIIASTHFVPYMETHATTLAQVGIFFPFVISAILKTAQGSSTVALVTTAGILGSSTDSTSLLSALGLSSPTGAILTVLAIGAGAMTVSHANDSYFWVVTNFGKIKMQDGYKTQTLVTLIMGITSILSIWVLSLFLI